MLQPSISVTLGRLGALDAVIACTRYCVEAVPALGSGGATVVRDSWSCTAEEILACRPTLVLASVPYRMESLAALLRAACTVVLFSPRSLADIQAETRLLGGMVRRPEAAEALVQELAGHVEQVRRRSSGASRRPRVYCEEWGKPLIRSQPWVAELVDAAGGCFLGEPGSQTTADAVRSEDPDVLVFAWCGAGDRVPLERVIAMRGWQNLRAVRASRVFCVPDEWLNTPAISLLEGLDALASILHPEIFPGNERVRGPHTVARPRIAI